METILMAAGLIIMMVIYFDDKKLYEEKLIHLKYNLTYARKRVNKLEDKIVELTWSKTIKQGRNFKDIK